ncbi:MAG: IPTL-CTERM sorting domain-containing protein [Candidatus Dadabacteria bacterium]|nr:IPTL-CTERM sorting domain-containing protein [Candidatus Dadabacteria bacterium]NIV42101.1 IPTL-CTERM sorting domain-containing protein [Candidatus Dadabacteria bacterium]NIX16430.1 IPTL-CTERM sorting domain-containing protein [Candidatus Dadabacteria bacterium]
MNFRLLYILLGFTTVFIISDINLANAGTPALCTITQITDTESGDNDRPWISDDGTRIVFRSSSNITGGNGDGNREIVMFDTNTDMFTQITNTTENTFPNKVYINSTGTHVVFDMNADIAGGNADLNGEVYLYNIAGNSITQITSTTGNNNAGAEVSSDGNLVFFHSSQNLDTNNADGSFEIFRYNVGTMTFSQLTDGANGSDSPSINSDNTLIAFQSTALFDGATNDSRRKIFLLDTDGSSISLITDTNDGANEEPSINSNGTRIAFQHESNINGKNPDGNFEISLFDTDTDAFTHITNGTGEDSFEPSIDNSGNFVAFYSRLNITGNNADGNRELHLFNAEEDSIIQITDTNGGSNRSPSINGDGSKIAFRSSSHLNGTNPDENREIYLAMCGDDDGSGDDGGPIVIVPTLSQWGMIFAVLIIGLFAVISLRRKESN